MVFGGMVNEIAVVLKSINGGSCLTSITSDTVVKSIVKSTVSVRPTDKLMPLRIKVWNPASSP